MNKIDTLKVQKYLETTKDIQSPFLQGKLLRVLLHSLNRKDIASKVTLYVRKYPNENIFANRKNFLVTPAAPKRHQKPPQKRNIPLPIPKRNALGKQKQKQPQKGKPQIKLAKTLSKKGTQKTALPTQKTPEPKKRDPKYNITNIPSGVLRAGKVQRNTNINFEKAFYKAGKTAVRGH